MLLEIIATLQTFRAIGMMASTSLPEPLKDFYAILGLFTLDFEFGVPGCGSAEPSTFVDTVTLNTNLLYNRP